MRVPLAVAVLLLSFSAVCRAQEPDFEAELAAVRAQRADLSVRPERWDTRSKLALPESILSDPLSAPSAGAALRSELSAVHDSYSLIAEAAKLLDSPLEVPNAAAPVQISAQIPAALAAPLGTLAAAIAQAQPLLDRAVASVPDDQRAGLLRSIGAIVDNSDQDAGDAATFDAADRFDLKDLLTAAAVLARAADAAIPGLRSAAKSVAPDFRGRWNLPSGAILVSGPGDRSYSAADIKDAALIVQLGGNNHYEGPLAAASTGQIRVAIDLGRDVSVNAGDSRRAASGVFGIGLLYLPQGDGRKALAASGSSAGSGLFGAGGLFLGGPAVIHSGALSQGAGAYGIGLLSLSGDASELNADFSSQGFGFTHGVGLFVARGDGAHLTCGMANADPREDKGSTSLCQGTGLGQRAFSAGGVGLALLEGSSNSLESSYFAQGAGYWHGLGALFMRGDGNRLKARRYDQGSGVHIAAGILSVEGSSNSLVNWGVGPGYGWDYGVGAFSLVGDSNTLYAEWGSGHGDINGRSLCSVQGNGNLLELPDFGSGAFKRNAPSYGLAEVGGQGNRLRVSELKSSATGPLLLSFDPWGALSISSQTILDPAPALPKPDWPAVAHPAAGNPGPSGSAGGPPVSPTVTETQGLKALLTAAAAFTTDPVTPQQAQRALFSLARDKAALAVGLASPDYYDEFLWLRTLVAVLGAPAAPELLAEIGASSGTHKDMLVGMLRLLPVSAGLSGTLALLHDADWRVRKDAIVSLGYWFDREGGEDTGRLRFLASALKLAKTAMAPDSAFEKGMIQEIGQKRLADAYAVLALDPGLPPEQRLGILDSANVVDPLPTQALRAFAAVLHGREGTFTSAIEAELKDSAALAVQARPAVLAALDDPDGDVRAAALAAVAQLGEAQDAGRLAAGLSDPAALPRESAAAALGRLGPGAKDAVLKALADASPRTRALAAIAAARSWDPEVFACLSKALEDADSAVRETAIAALSAVQEPMRPERVRFAAALERLAAQDSSASVRAAAAVELARQN